MSLFSTLNTGASGLGVSGTAMSVIGDNIANINTIGFKSGRAEFSDLLPNYAAGLGGPVQIGTGAGTAAVSTLFGQGSIDASENPLDMAISGSGMFVVASGDDQFYTRAGAFFLDPDGFVVTSSGLRLQGYLADGTGLVSPTLTDLQLDASSSSPKATTSLILDATLDPDADYSTTPITSGTYTLDGNTNTIEEVNAAADFSTSTTIYDSLGQPHDATVLFERTASGTWSWSAIVDGGEVGATDGMAFQISGGTMGFDTDGNMNAFTQTDVGGWTFDGAAPTALVFDFGFDGTVATEGSTRMIAGESAVTSIAQDGFPPGTLANLTVDPDGTVRGSYSNGEDLVLGQVALASFDSMAGLERVGGSLYRATSAAGEPSIGAAGTGARGSIEGYALEASNVDLEDEFVSMIQTQRSYQASARVISTVNDTLSELVNLL